MCPRISPNSSTSGTHATGALNHPNVVAIYDTGTHNGAPYLVSELLQGEVLQQKLSGHPLPFRKTIDYAFQIAKGLFAAHENGIIHRDLKPGNIFITKEGLYALMGEQEVALDQIEYVLSIPNGVPGLSVPLLRIDPGWDPLRDHPRFQRILARVPERALR